MDESEELADEALYNDLAYRDAEFATRGETGAETSESTGEMDLCGDIIFDLQRAD